MYGLKSWSARPRDPAGGPWIPELGQEINWMTLESLTFVIFVPCAWLMGIPYEEVTIAAHVLAKKGFHGHACSPETSSG